MATALVVALFAGGAALPAAAQQAPGWLNWGGGSEEPAESDEAAPAASRQSAPMPATPVTGADTGSQSGQAELLQRLMQRVDELERQVQGMRGQLSEQERIIERQQRRLDEVEQATRAAASAGPGAAMGRGDPVAGDVPDEPIAAVGGDNGEQPGMPPSSVTAVAGAGVPTGDSGGARVDSQADGQADDQASGGASAAEQQALYNEAFEILKSGKYDQAIDAFQKVIDANPQGEWSASALFWQGETYYVQQDYAAAGKAYAEVIERFPESSRIPDAKLKLGYVAQERGETEAARRLFNEILDQYPDSQAAGLARQRLARMNDG